MGLTIILQNIISCLTACHSSIQKGIFIVSKILYLWFLSSYIVHREPSDSFTLFRPAQENLPDVNHLNYFFKLTKGPLNTSTGIILFTLSGYSPTVLEVCGKGLNSDAQKYCFCPDTFYSAISSDGMTRYDKLIFSEIISGINEFQIQEAVFTYNIKTEPPLGSGVTLTGDDGLLRRYSSTGEIIQTFLVKYENDNFIWVDGVPKLPEGNSLAVTKSTDDFGTFVEYDSVQSDSKYKFKLKEYEVCEWEVPTGEMANIDYAYKTTRDEAGNVTLTKTDFPGDTSDKVKIFRLVAGDNVYPDFYEGVLKKGELVVALKKLDHPPELTPCTENEGWFLDIYTSSNPVQFFIRTLVNGLKFNRVLGSRWEFYFKDAKNANFPDSYFFAVTKSNSSSIKYNDWDALNFEANTGKFFSAAISTQLYESTRNSRVKLLGWCKILLEKNKSLSDISNVSTIRALLDEPGVCLRYTQYNDYILATGTNKFTQMQFEKLAVYGDNMDVYFTKKEGSRSSSKKGFRVLYITEDGILKWQLVGELRMQENNYNFSISGNFGAPANDIPLQKLQALMSQASAYFASNKNNIILHLYSSAPREGPEDSELIENISCNITFKKLVINTS